jgi:hypothetical protein
MESLYMMPCGHILDFLVHVKLVHKAPTWELSNLFNNLVREIEEGLLKNWESDTEKWQGIELWDILLMLVICTFNGISVSNPLCANQKYLDNTRRYVTSIYTTLAIIHVFPSWVKLLIGPILSIPYLFLY